MHDPLACLKQVTDIYRFRYKNLPFHCMLYTDDCVSMCYREMVDKKIILASCI